MWLLTSRFQPDSTDRSQLYYRNNTFDELAFRTRITPCDFQTRSHDFDPPLLATFYKTKLADKKKGTFQSNWPT